MSFHRIGPLGQFGLIVAMSLCCLSPSHAILPWEQRRSQGSIAVSHCGISTLNKMLHLTIGPQSKWSGPVSHCGINTLKNVLLNYWSGPVSHRVINTLKNVTLNYWPSDHMIRSRQPVVTSIPWKKTLHLTMGYWLLSSHVERVGDSHMRDFSLYMVTNVSKQISVC